MKKKILLTLCALAQAQAHICNITIQSTWRDLETPRETKLFGSKWIQVATVTFKRTSALKEPIFLDRLQFAWNGPRLSTLRASLFKKTPNKPFSPVEEALLCDGTWNGNSQQLSFSFNDEQRLDPVTTFYIVVTIPNGLETLLQQGTFTLIQSCLPDELQEHAEPLLLSFSVRAPYNTTLG